MKKLLIFISLLLPIAAVNAQTFQRKVQQPGFFMPKSAIPNQQPERLPAIESMNYQGRRVINSAPEADNYEYEAKKVQNNNIPEQPIAEQIEKIEKTVELNKPEIENKSNESEYNTVVTQSETEKTLPDKIKQAKTTGLSETQNPLSIEDAYQKMFAQILSQHYEDLEKISKGKTVKNPDIEAMLDRYDDKVYTITDTIYPRSVKLQ